MAETATVKSKYSGTGILLPVCIKRFHRGHDHFPLPDWPAVLAHHDSSLGCRRHLGGVISKLKPQHFLLGEEVQALLFEDGAGLGERVDFDDQHGTVVGHKARTVFEVDAVAAKNIRHPPQ